MEKRKINVDKLTEDQLSSAIDNVSNKVMSEANITKEKIDAMLSRYGLCCELHISIKSIAEESDKIS